MLRVLLFLFVALPFICSAKNVPSSLDISDWHPPLDYLLVTDLYGHRSHHPTRGEPAFHAGIDFRARTSLPVYAVADGWVTMSDISTTYGKIVEIEHEGEIFTRYAHLSKIMYRAMLGKEVNKGDIIGYTGNTGESTFAHLHFEIRVEGVPQDPFTLYGQLPCKHNIRHDLCSGYYVTYEAIVP